jgi:hypothetical protein
MLQLARQASLSYRLTRCAPCVFWIGAAVMTRSIDGTDELADDCVAMGIKKTWELAVGLAPRNTRLTAACRRRPTASLQKTGQENS